MKFKSIVLGATLSFASVFTASGAPVLHGANAVVCRGGNGIVSRAEVLDLYEAREVYGLRVPPIQDVVVARTTLLANLHHRFVGISAYPYFLETTIASLHSHFQVLPHGSHLPLLPDHYPPIPVAGCRIEQLASFDDTGAIQLDGDILAALDGTNRLALELHETVDYLDRKWAHTTDSVFARHLVGLLLADNWGTPLDVAVKSYALNVPSPGSYLTGIGSCTLQLAIGIDGSIQLTPDAICQTTIDWTAFSESGSAILFPSGNVGEWTWTDHQSPPNRLVFSQIDLNSFNLDSVTFRRAN